MNFTWYNKKFYNCNHVNKGSRHFTYPVGNKLSKKEVKKILKNEKKLAETEMVRKNLEDPYGKKDSSDHYQAQLQSYKIEYQKELLCTGHSIRVIILLKTYLLI